MLEALKKLLENAPENKQQIKDLLIEDFIKKSDEIDQSEFNDILDSVANNSTAVDCLDEIFMDLASLQSNISDSLEQKLNSYRYGLIDVTRQLSSQIEDFTHTIAECDRSISRLKKEGNDGPPPASSTMSQQAIIGKYKAVSEQQSILQQQLRKKDEVNQAKENALRSIAIREDLMTKVEGYANKAKSVCEKQEHSFRYK